MSSRIKWNIAYSLVILFLLAEIYFCFWLTDYFR